MVKTLDSQKHQEQRLRLLAQARRLIANQGFKETSMAQIAKACKVTKATLYHYFKNKQDILSAILGCHNEEVEALRARLSKVRDLEELLYAIASHQLDKMSRAENLDFLKILVNEAMTNPEVKKYYLGIIKNALTMAAREMLAPFVKGRMTETEVRRTYFQFIAALSHYTWQVKIVGGLSDVIGNDESYIRLLSKVYAGQLLKG